MLTTCPYMLEIIRILLKRIRVNGFHSDSVIFFQSANDPFLAALGSCCYIFV